MRSGGLRIGGNASPSVRRKEPLGEVRKSTILTHGDPTKHLAGAHSLVAKMRQSSRSLEGDARAVYARADEEYQAYTSQVSLITRTLALTAIAVIWLFASGKQGSNLAPFIALRRLESARPLLVSLGFALGALVMDLLQYAWGSIAWGTYRWSLDQVLVNDTFDPSDLPIRVRLGWAIARLYGLAQRFEYSLGKSGSGVSWKGRREELRRRIRSLTAGKEQRSLQAVFSSTWAPLMINRIVSLFYTLKVLSLLVSYAFLAIYLFD